MSKVAHPPRTAVILLAAGSGSRVGGEVNKVLLSLAGRPVLAWSVRVVRDLPYVERVVVVVRPEDRPAADAAVGAEAAGLPVSVVGGGTTRHESEWHALSALAEAIDAGELDVVVIHDAARPLAGPDLFTSVAEAAARFGGALPVRRQDALVSRDGATLPSGLVAVQTPQAFRAAPLLAAYRAAEADGFTGTDTASCVERYSDLAIHCVDAPATNLKVTFPEDVDLAGRLLSRPR